jgi:hypothetical protein
MRLCRPAVALSIHRGWSRQRDPIENFADEKVSLNGGQIFADDLIVEPQTKQASRVAWCFKLNDNPLDGHPFATAHADDLASRSRRRSRPAAGEVYWTCTQTGSKRAGLTLAASDV